MIARNQSRLREEEEDEEEAPRQSFLAAQLPAAALAAAGVAPGADPSESTQVLCCAVTIVDHVGEPQTVRSVDTPWAGATCPCLTLEVYR